MTIRRPRTAAQSSALPSLAALLATGVAVEGCGTADDSALRMRRLTERGELARNELDRHREELAAREIAVGLGLINAPPETRISAPGEAPVVRVDEPMTPGGAPPPIAPTPPATPPNVDVDGGFRRVDPTPPTPPVIRHTPPMHTAGARAPIRPDPHHPNRITDL